MHFTDFTLAENVKKLYASERQVLVEMCDVLLIARQPIEGFGDDNLKLTASRAFQ